ncbi:MAG: efflux RND transporter periplasmic adaptor subunit [Salinivirgaceae bacterium]|nr:efflux RND transporter periplasmic adaptor subunit [Salinivirgaceae bacterium]
MKKLGNIILVMIIVAVVGYIVWKNSNSKVSVTVNTEQPFMTTIEQKRFVPGNLYPLTEIDIKSQISGTLEKVFVKIGDKVKIGDNIAQIKLIPDPSNLERAKSNLNSAKINFENNKRVYERNEELFNKSVIPAIEFDEYKRALDMSKEQYLSAQNQLTLISEGSVRDADISNIIKATASGTIIDLPLKEGSSVIERNNFNNGTTIATVADIETFIFRGKVNESDMKYLYTGMNLTLNLNAYKNQFRQAKLNKISAKGIEDQGIMKYFIEAGFSLINDSLVIRSGYSANAEISLQKKENVLAIKEKYLQFQNDSVYLNIMTPEGKEEKRFITTGLSDGINIEITDGINIDEKFKITDK